MDYDVLVKVLRENAGVAAASDRPEYATSYNHAADAIVQLQERVAELEARLQTAEGLLRYPAFELVQKYFIGETLGDEPWRAEILTLRNAAFNLSERAERAEADLAAALALLPGVYYMDPPDGGSVMPEEQIRRMADDAKRYRQAEADLAAARALLREVRPHVLCGYREPRVGPIDLVDRIDAALDGKDAP
jgi:hypothetical protein